MNGPERRCDRVLVIGLDCLAPRLAFDRYLDAMPAVRSLLDGAVWGELRSCDPPITVPAWMVMATSRDPGTLGAYGFRHRRDHGYVNGWTANATTFTAPAVWDELARDGGLACLAAFPPSYPPVAVPGWRVGCFLTPGPESQFAYPAGLGEEVLRAVPDYRFDVVFRTDSRDRLLAELYAMTDGHFTLAERLLAGKPWELFWLVEIGVDRAHHAFWKFCDAEHPAYEPGHRFETAIRDYYTHVDERVGALLELVGDETAVLLVSDHGAKAMRGALAVNQWLAERGWLVLEAPPEGPGTPLERCSVDWARTRAWAWGGYYARLFLNVVGREPSGTIPTERYDETLSELTAELTAIPDHEGRPLATRVFRPEELYRECRGDAPDLMVYFDDLSWRAAGTLGWDDVYLFENDTGPDDAVHAHEACFALRAPGLAPRHREAPVPIYDVAPTILSLLGRPVPDEMQGAPCV